VKPGCLLPEREAGIRETPANKNPENYALNGVLNEGEKMVPTSGITSNKSKTTIPGVPSVIEALR